MLLAWANEWSDVLKIAHSHMGLIVVAKIFIYPVIALAAIWLALRDRLLGLAFAFVALPTVVFWTTMGPFVIGVMIYGF
jgi:hypothetical protein